MSLPRDIWMYWDKGWENAPANSQDSQKSWRIRNPGWKVHSVDLVEVDKLLGPTWRRIKTPSSITPNAFANLVRLELLTRFGGVWADATTYCLRPLDSWIDAAAASGMFGFRSPGPGRPLSNWFLAGQAGNIILEKWLDASWDYWRDREEMDAFFWQHRQFGNLLQNDKEFREAWQSAPNVPARHRFHFGPDAKNLNAPPEREDAAALATGSIHVVKTTNRRNPGGPGSLMSYIRQSLTLPVKPGKRRLVFHVGLTNTGTTTLQNWAANHRQLLSSFGIIYPVSIMQPNSYKHPEIGQALQGGGFYALRSLMLQAPQNGTLFLSNEAGTNHLPEGESEPARLAEFRSLFSEFDEVTLVMVTRDREEWLRSCYRQRVVNRPGNPAFLHGTALEFEAFSQEPRISQLMELEQLGERLRVAYEPDFLVRTKLETSWIEDIFDALRAPCLAADLRNAPAKNVGLNDIQTEFIRQLNALRVFETRDLVIEWMRGNSDPNTPWPTELQEAISKFRIPSSGATPDYFDLLAALRHRAFHAEAAPGDFVETGRTNNGAGG